MWRRSRRGGDHAIFVGGERFSSAADAVLAAREAAGEGASDALAAAAIGAMRAKGDLEGARTALARLRADGRCSLPEHLLVAHGMLLRAWRGMDGAAVDELLGWAGAAAAGVVAAVSVSSSRHHAIFVYIHTHNESKRAENVSP